MSCTVLCAETGCKHNNGGGYYGVCKHPVTKEQHYNGGIDRIYREKCALREFETGTVEKCVEGVSKCMY